MLDVDLSIREFDGRAVVALRGELNLADSPGVASHLIAAVAACGPSVIVDMAGLDGIGDGALPVLVRVLTWTRRSGGDLPLVAPQRPVRQVLEAAGLLDVFSVYPSVEHAANSATLAQPWCRLNLVPDRGPAGLPGRGAAIPCRLACHVPANPAAPAAETAIDRRHHHPGRSPLSSSGNNSCTGHLSWRDRPW
jgi:anti-anti-sigma factor